MGLFASSRKKPPALDRETSLRGIPVLNPSVELNPREDGNITLRVKIRRKQGSLASRFLPPVFERNVELDELGSFVVRQIDGQADTRHIIQSFARHYALNRREAELSCVKFLRSLAERRVIAIAIK